ncbi:alpha/beta fold hydrolase [Dyadobacter tibetensis]|uniref:alpha/beta fold hydrolase n=1 Tax=Dyadobacter tibetensis TaxID=1211851 RepID=UPI00046FD88C|nr:alpha/beta hydrolase [Dyadobacter tibetensis]
MIFQRKTLVLLHGHGMDDSIWDQLDAILNDSFTIIRPNISLLTSCQTVEDYADELYRLLTNANIQRCTLIGHSMGGYIGLAFAKKYPEMLQGFGLFHSTALADDEAKKHQRNQMVSLLRTYGTASFMKNTAPNLFGTRYRSLHPDKVQEHVDFFAKLPEEALVSGIHAMRERSDQQEVLKTINVPVLIILGMEDNFVPFESGMDLSTLPAQCYPFILAEAGHMGMIERPDATARMIRWYMSKV